jgi:hypothetical protein
MIGISETAHCPARDVSSHRAKETGGGVAQLSFSDVFQIQLTACDSMEYFRAGEKAGFSGVHKIVHEKDHIPPHCVTALYGELFPY